MELWEKICSVLHFRSFINFHIFHLHIRNWKSRKVSHFLLPKSARYFPLINSKSYAIRNLLIIIIIANFNKTQHFVTLYLSCPTPVETNLRKLFLSNSFCILSSNCQCHCLLIFPIQKFELCSGRTNISSVRNC